MVYDIILRLNQNSDDREIDYRQVAHWLSLARDKEMRQYLNENGNEVPPSMLTERECVALNKGEDCHGCTEYTIDLPFGVMDVRDDIGVYQVLRPGGKPLTRRSSAGISSMLANSRFNDKTGWYRVGNQLTLTGSFPEGMTFTLLLIAASVGDLEETDDFPAPSELLLVISEEAEMIGRRMLSGVYDYSNDGAGDPVLKGA